MLIMLSVAPALAVAFTAYAKYPAYGRLTA